MIDLSAQEFIPEILVVEDSETDTMLMMKALSHSTRAKNIVSLRDGERAMSYLRERKQLRPDLILLDLNLPKKDGWEVLRECKADPDLRSIPVVVFTTSRLDSDVARCYALGANCVVSKPFELSPFLGAIQGIEDYWLGLAERSAKG
jgi:chemotaxis family two-component system response regulator Rcp1